MAVASANRGRKAESLVKKKLTALEAANFAHYRLPDTHAGSFTRTLADFMFVKEGKLILLEVKETVHEFRLPYGNLKVEQIATLRAWKSAGARGHVLIYHSTTKLWRAADISWFFLNYKKVSETGKPIGSWDLSSIPTGTLDSYFETHV